MAASPEFKVYDSAGKYQAACKEIAAAVSLMGLYGEGSTIRHRHGFIAWTEGQDGDSMALGYYKAEWLIFDRLVAHYKKPRRDFDETRAYP